MRTSLFFSAALMAALASAVDLQAQALTQTDITNVQDHTPYENLAQELMGDDYDNPFGV